MAEGSAPSMLQWSTVEHYLGEGLAASYRLSPAASRPLVTYEIGDSGRDIALHVELDRHQRPPRSQLPAVYIDQVSHQGVRMARIRTTEVALMRDFHDLLMSVAGRIVSGGRTLEVAFGETVRAWSALLERPRAAALRKRLGLHGELAVLRLLAARYGWSTALDAWTGPEKEQHDFSLPQYDLEVKTTSSERHLHTMNGLGQLQTTSGRPLWLVFIRLTRGGAGGRSLTESVDAVRDAAAAQNVTLGAKLTRSLAAAGWSDEDTDDERWTPRDTPLLLAAEDVPGITFAHVTPQIAERVSAVRYDIDVTGLAPTPAPPVTLTDFRLP
ncbi:PD-(D/E)XK motif protein [Streptomyces sp. enrichment culture]|uniref:PD-(D/E)XK motif protein n=1 Tax=Streptomyces sp. enrichment culture TaxID=1795815 RepID=UPI003F5698D0